MNSLHPLSEAIVAFAAKAHAEKRDGRFVQNALRRARKEPIAGQFRSFTIVRGFDRRADVLFSVYQHEGQHAAEIAKRISLPIARTEAHLEQLAALGLITYGVDEGLARAKINRRFRYAAPLFALLEGARFMKYMHEDASLPRCEAVSRPLKPAER